MQKAKNSRPVGLRLLRYAPFGAMGRHNPRLLYVCPGFPSVDWIVQREALGLEFVDFLLSTTPSPRAPPLLI
jgi:hypothetical protein